MYAVLISLAFSHYSSAVNSLLVMSRLWLWNHKHCVRFISQTFGLFNIEIITSRFFISVKDCFSPLMLYWTDSHWIQMTLIFLFWSKGFFKDKNQCIQHICCLVTRPLSAMCKSNEQDGLHSKLSSLIVYAKFCLLKFTTMDLTVFS